MNFLVINPGSTSTKVAIYENTTPKCNRTIRHSMEDLSAFPKLMDQLEYRKALVMDFLAENDFTPKKLDCVISRGGSPPNAKSGATTIDENLVDALIERPLDQNPASLGPVIANSIAKEGGIPAYIYDPITTNELNPLARVFGVKGIEHDSMGHVLNTRAMGIAVAKELGRPFDRCNFIVVHIGGGNSVSLWSKGKLTDTFPTDYGTFSAERCGSMRIGQMVSLIEEYGLDTIKSWLGGKGGMVSLVGTNELKKVEDLIVSGDEQALLCEEAMAYQLSKLIAALFPVVHGKLDGIIITGGGAYWDRLTDDIQEWVACLNTPVFIRPGENEMQALAEGAYRVMAGEEIAHKY